MTPRQRAVLWDLAATPLDYSAADLFRVPTTERGRDDSEAARAQEASHRLELVMAYTTGLTV